MGSLVHCLAQIGVDLLVHVNVGSDGECQLFIVSSVSFCVEVKLGRRFFVTAINLPWPIPREG